MATKPAYPIQVIRRLVAKGQVRIKLPARDTIVQDGLHQGYNVYTHFHVINQGSVDETLIIVSMKDRYK